jgi:hypothetical protein
MVTFTDDQVLWYYIILYNHLHNRFITLYKLYFDFDWRHFDINYCSAPTLTY